MGGSISSLGIGSGVLTSDIIDQLKEADTSRIVTPMEDKITKNNQKQDAQDLLNNLMKSLKTSASALSFDTVFDNKTIDINGNAEVTVDAGATVESFTLETVALAKKDITSMGALASNASNVATGAGTMSIGGYTINYDATTTLEGLAQEITDVAGSTVSASILQTGTGAYSLVISSKSTGASEALTITDDTGLMNADLFDPAAGYLKVQNAIDSEFKYNGVTITRSTNEISDLIIGVEITLKEEGDLSTVDIQQDTGPIVDEVQLFVDSYNTLMTNLTDMTAKDEQTGAEGIFNGSSFVKSISRELNRAITSLVDTDSLLNYGIDIDRYGTMSFNSTTLEENLASDSDSVKLFFTGGTNASGNEVTGIFESINEKINSYTGYGELLSNFADELKSDGDTLSDSYAKAKASLETRYEIMTKRFIAYDGIISKLNSQFSSMQMMISAELNSK